jgi:crotonobetaine/carnitine-CoA ligase
LQSPVEPWDDHMVMFTGGTTGRSKAVRRPYVLYLKMVEAAFDHVGVGGADRFLVCAPMFHGGADVPIYAMLRAGGSVAIVRGFRTQNFWDDARRSSCSVAWIHSAMAHFLWEQPRRPNDADNPLRLAMQAPLLPAFREFGERFGTRIYTVYGMTELPCPFSILDPVDHRTLGKPIDPDYELRLVDEHDREVPQGVPGELLARHRVPWAITPGYLHDAEATATAWRNGWFHGGDVFVQEADGNFALVGRVKDSIRRRGENVSCERGRTRARRAPGCRRGGRDRGRGRDRAGGDGVRRAAFGRDARAPRARLVPRTAPAVLRRAALHPVRGRPAAHRGAAGRQGEASRARHLVGHVGSRGRRHPPSPGAPVNRLTAPRHARRDRRAKPGS